MSRLEHLKGLWDRANTALDLPTLEKTTAMWRSAAKAEKLELESSNLKRTMRSESARFWVPVIATFVSSAALVGTLFSQIRQFKENTRLQTEASEDTQYREALKSIENPERIHGAIGIPLLKSFFDSPRYGSQAREVALNVMVGMVDQESFRSFFDPIAERTDWSNYRPVVRLEAALYEQWVGWHSDLDKLEKYEEGTQKKTSQSEARPEKIPYQGPEPAIKKGTGPPIPLSEVKHMKEQKEKELWYCEDFLIQFLRKKRAPNQTIDLSGASPVYLGGKDLTGLDLRGAILSDAVFDESKLDGADLSDVSQYEQSSWGSVAWWRAAKISSPLVKYLKEFYPYSSERKYDKPSTQEEYDRELARFR